MIILNKIKAALNIAYRGHRIGIKYEGNQETFTLKALVDALNLLVILYATYSELSQKFLDLFAVPNVGNSYAMGRVLISVLGAFICGYILFSRKGERRNVYTYPKFPRIVAGIIIWPVMLAFITSLYSLVFTSKPYVGPYSASFPVATESWSLQKASGQGAKEVRIYSADIIVPDGLKNGYKHLQISIAPSEGFRLVDVFPEERPGIASQEPEKVGKQTSMFVEWRFPLSDDTRYWKLIVVIGKANKDVSFPEQPPIVGHGYLYKD